MIACVFYPCINTKNRMTYVVQKPSAHAIMIFVHHM